ncbi:PREDICTED: uncharacterized protein LOC109240506 [Nicotiana attenuata]|uniref:Uncharacterized protein n=1 Tax=Nicotiana attenuata TaxID=49451 RepID=A0A314L762_NICAT|nr:PREDICTED: uncharacterized protein LOC109240506 [Nicotiana attenuata]OIT37621.1 hypothetical protein A4A49_36637 [Nicotiana attenuata]
MLKNSQSLVSASACCTVEQEVKEESINVIDEISAELQRERQKNKELMDRISVLESQIQENHKDFELSNGKSSCQSMGEMHFRKLKRPKMDSEVKDHTEIFNKDVNTDQECLVNWMNIDDTQFLNLERSKDGDTAADNDPDDSEDIDDEESDDSGTYNNSINRENFKNSQIKEKLKEDLGEASDPPFRRKGSSFSHKKSVKVAFCPKEVKKILESKELSVKNAQSHTIRKILVFSSLGIRHGCEDMYELDFKHFSILHKGEQYTDSKNPGEHVLYDNPGVRMKIFYPNRQNPNLCPVRILEEEKVMRPSDVSCPSCLFLCIKYGGKTRNLPLNEYVRQRMGRNKLKSFGPAICRMAMLVHIRSGSFFFKAIGITLLFMAGFPNDLVQRETKYKNLDLLQKYNRTDEDAEREELFLSHTEPDTINISPNSQQGKKVSTKTKSKREAISKSKTSEKATIIHSEPSSSAPPTPSGLMNISIPSSQAQADMSKPVLANIASNIPYHNQCAYPVLPIYPPNSVVPLVYWPQPNVFPTFPYPSSYRYIAPGSCISINPYSYYGHLYSNPLNPETLGTEKQNGRSDDAQRESNSSTSSTDSREK